MVKHVCVSVERLCQNFCCVAMSLARRSQRADSPSRTSTGASRMYKQGREAVQVSPVAGSEGSPTTRKYRQEVVLWQVPLWDRERRKGFTWCDKCLKQPSWPWSFYFLSVQLTGSILISGYSKIFCTKGHAHPSHLCNSVKLVHVPNCNFSLHQLSKHRGQTM